MMSNTADIIMSDKMAGSEKSAMRTTRSDIDTRVYIHPPHPKCGILGRSANLCHGLIAAIAHLHGSL